MKILLTLPISITSTNSQDQTGANSYTLAISKELLSHSEHEFLIITDSDPLELFKHLEHIPIKTHINIFPCEGSLTYIQNFDPDIIFSSDIYSELLLQCRAHTNIKAPLLSLAHVLGSHKSMTDFNYFLENAQEKDCLICPSESIARTAINLNKAYFKLNKPLHYALMPHGIPSQQFSAVSAIQKQQIRQQLSLPADTVIAIGVGRINAYSKQDLIAFFRQLEQLREAGEDFLYLHIGHNHDKDYCHFLHDYATKADISDCIRLVHDVKPQDIHSYYQSADFFISIIDNPSESFSLAANEAMACGLPVLLNHVCLYKHRIEDGLEGYFIPSIGASTRLFEPFLNDPSAEKAYAQLSLQSYAMDNHYFRDRFKELLHNKALRKAMGKAALSRSRDFQLSNSITQYLELFSSLITDGDSSYFLHEDQFPATEHFLNHLSSKTLHEKSRFQLTRYGRDVLHSRKQLEAYQFYIDYFQKLGHILYHLQKEAVTLKDLATRCELSYPDCLESCLFLLKQDLIQLD